MRQVNLLEIRRFTRNDILAVSLRRNKVIMENCIVESVLLPISRLLRFWDTDLEPPILICQPDQFCALQ